MQFITRHIATVFATVSDKTVAIELMLDETEAVGFDTQTFLSLHGLLSENLMPDPDASGRLRCRPVQIGGSVFVPLAVPQLIEECFRDILGKPRRFSECSEQKV